MSLLIAATAAASFAIVTLDQASLRAAPKADAAQHARLSAGDLLEVRGERLDHLQVYDHRRERAGYVRVAQVRRVALDDATQAPQLLSVVRFLRDTPGAEALGIAYVAAYLKTAPAQAIGAEPFDALGVIAERLARRASARDASKGATAMLETVGAYGVTFNNFEVVQGSFTLCYEGDAFRRVLAHPAADVEQKARAALALTRADCVDPAKPVLERAAWQRERAHVLDASFGAAEFARLNDTTKQRVRARRAAVWAAIAFDRSRRSGEGLVAGDGAIDDAAVTRVAGITATSAAQRALDEFTAIDRSHLADDDLADYTDAALRSGASRWAATVSPKSSPSPSSRLAFTARPGDEPGRTCVRLEAVTAKTAPASDRARVVEYARRCTFGTVHLASARFAPDARTAVLAVQALEAWTELWVFRLQPKGGWTVDVLPPATVSSTHAIGYIEFAGFVPGQPKLLVAREALGGSSSDGKLQRRFEVLKLDAGYAADRWASDPALLVAFGRWGDAAWKQGSVSLR